jgi:RND family efflux transporter MFP subunit
MKYLLGKIFAITLIILFSSCGKQETSPEIPVKGTAISVSLIALEKTQFSGQIQTSGNFTTRDETLLSFKVGGIISKVFVNEGDPVKPGQLLATLDLTEIQAGANQAKLGYEKALRDYERAERLFKDSVATLEQFENSKTALDIAIQQVRTADFNLNYAQIRSGKNGFVLRKFVNAGQLVSSGSPVLQINGAISGDWLLQATVNDLNWSQIQSGDLAMIFPANNETGFPGKVIRKSQAADPLTGTYWIEISPDQNEELKLAAGMFGKAIITPTQSSAGWQIPFEALLDAQGSTGYVFITVDGKTAKKVPVQLGKIAPAGVEVRSGLENYNQLIVSGSAYLTDGSPIAVKKP